MKELVKVDAKEFGLEEQKAAQIAAQFKPMLDKMVELEKEYNEVIKLDINDPETSEKAKAIRLKYVKVRTGTAAIHKEQKAFYLAGGKFVDGWKNAQIFASQGIESKLLDIEKHAEKLEQERINTLQNERVELCKPFVQNEMEILSNLGTLPDSIWDNYITGLETSYNARIEAEKKRLEQLEADKKEAERINKLHFHRYNELAPFQEFTANIIDYNSCEFALMSEKEYSDIKARILKAKSDYEKEQEKIRLENEKLKKEAELKAKQDEKERIERERLAKIEAEKQAELKAKQDAIIAKQKAESEAKLKAEKEKANKLATELKAKQDTELAEKKRLEQLEADKKEAEKQAALAPEKDKITIWINSIELPDINTIDFSSGGEAVVNVITAKFESFKKWAELQKESIK